MGTAITALFMAVTEVGASRLSKTKLFSHAAGATGLWAILPGVLEKDPVAIGNLVLYSIAWVGTLWGRGNKG